MTEEIEESIELVSKALQELGYETRNVSNTRNMPIYEMQVFKDGFSLGSFKLIIRGKLLVKASSRFLGVSKEISLFDPDSLDRIVRILDPIVPLSSNGKTPIS